MIKANKLLFFYVVPRVEDELAVGENREVFIIIFQVNL